MKETKMRFIKGIAIIFLVVILLFTYLPIIVIALTSFSSDKFGLSMTAPTFNWYQTMWTSRSLMNSIIYTLQISICSTVLSVIFGTISAIGIHSLNRNLKRKVIMLNNVPILNTDIVTAVFLLIIFQLVGMVFNKSVFGFTTTLIAHVLFSTPYVVLSVLPKLNVMNDSSLYEASLDLGCSPKKALFKVIIPNIKTGILTGGLLAFTMSIDDFIITYFVTGKRQNFSTWLYGSLKTLRNGLWNQACAYNTLLLIITFVVVISYQVIKINKDKRMGVK